MIHNDQSTPGTHPSFHPPAQPTPTSLINSDGGLNHHNTPTPANTFTNCQQHHHQELSALAQFDNDNWVGDTPPPDDNPHNTFRLIFNNVNSLGSQQYRHKIQELANIQQHMCIDYFGITEHCLNANQHDVVRNLHTSLHKHNRGQCTFQINSGKMSTNTPYLPGGTAILAMGPTIGRIEPHGKQGDPMGRWSSITYRRHHKPPLTVYTVYQVNAQPTNDIGITAWHQQRLSLDAQNRHSIHPRTAFVEDLIGSIQQHQQNEHDIILGGDFNDTIHRNRSNILKLATSTGLVDPWTYLFPDQENFSTYFRGTQRIDSVLCSPHLIPLITTLSYSPYNWITNSDHRAILLDFNETALFGGHADPLPTMNMRSIRSNDRQNVAIFIKQWYQHLVQNAVFKRLEKLQDHPLTPDDIERIDRIIGQGGDSAECKCRRRRSTMYTNTISRLRTIKSIIQGHIRALLRNAHKNPATFQSRLNRHGIDYQLATNTNDAQHQLETIRTELKEAIATHKDQRAQEQAEHIARAVETGKHTKATAISTIKRQEARRRVWQTLQYTRRRGDFQHRGLDRLDIPVSWPPPFQDPTTIPNLEDPKLCQEWTTVTQPEEVEYYLQLRNRLHFGQAQGTPFTESPFVDSLDWAATSPTCEDILAGQYTTTISDVPQCQALIDTCRTVSDLDLIPAEITHDDFAGKLKSWKETTSTSPSGRHLGRYKSLFARGPFDPKSESEEERFKHQQFTTAQAAIANAILSLINACILTGHVLERWKTIVNTMIFKDIGNFKVHRLRVIHIYEADFNLLLAVKWRQLLRSAEQRNAINNGLFGGRPGCEAQSLTFLEELKYDISYTSRRTLFNFDNDATSCYDRIIVSLASLINRKYGQHRKIVLIHSTTLQQARFHLRTHLGYSSSFYSHCIQYPIYGSGQGSGNSPCIWLFISSTLCDVHATQAHGATFTSPVDNESVRLTMVGFVDDSTGACNDFRPQTQSNIETIASWMQADAQSWNDLLWCSGGKLELPKCSYHLLHFTFKPNGAPQPTISTPSGVTINIIDAETNQHIPIPSKQANDPHKTLGHWKSPADPRQRRQLEALTQKSLQLMITITTSPLTRFGATIAYHSVYIPAIKYVLPQSFFSAQALYKAERKSIHKILAKCGFNRHTALAIRYAPLTYAGCGFVQWYTLQGEGQILLFIKHWRTTTVISQTLRVNLSWCQWQSGLSTPILTDTHTLLPHLESRWLKSLRTFLRSIRSTISLDHSFTVPSERKHDTHIMDYVTNNRSFSSADVVIINYCRLYLHVTTISELFDASGQRILPNMFRCFRPAWFDTDRYITLQPKPSEYQIRKKWQKLCRHWCTDDGHIAASVLLGPWAPHDPHYHSRRESYFSDNTNTELYHWIDSTYWRLSPIPGKPSYYQPGHSTSWKPTHHAIPATLQRIPTQDQPEYLVLFPIPVPSSSSIPRPSPIARRATPPWDHPLLSEVVQEQSDAIPEMVTLIQESATKRLPLLLTFTADISDQYATYSWILGNKSGDRIAWHHGHFKGTITKHRATLWGHLSALRFLRHLLTDHNTDPLLLSKLRIYTTSDYSPAITSYKHRRKYIDPYPNATLKRDWDIIEAIHVTYQEMNPNRIYLKWTQLQDHHLCAKPNTLSSKLQFAVDARKLSEASHSQVSFPYHTLSRQPFLPAGRCTLHLSRQPITDKYSKHIREAAAIPPLLEYLRNKNNWDRNITKDINWDWFTKSVRTYGRQHQNHLTKLVYDKLPTNMVTQKSGGQSWLPTLCRYCANDHETFDHLIRCHHPHGELFRTNLITAITKHCTHRSIPPTFRRTIITSVTDWLIYDDPTVSRHDTLADHMLLQAQNQIGWKAFFRGFLTNQWQTYLETEQRRTLPPDVFKNFDHEHFFSRLIKILWTQQTEFWTTYQEHLHSPTPQPNGPTTNERLRKFQLEVRYLYSLRSETEPHHRDTYFPVNVHTFITRSTIDQLQHYVENFRQPILRSVHAHKSQRRKPKPIWTFSGFNRLPFNPTSRNHTTENTAQERSSSPPKIRHPQRHRKADTTTRRTYAQKILLFRPTSLIRTTATRQSRPHPTHQERVPHKHSKWKRTQAVRDSFLAYFHRASTNTPN